MCTIGQVRVSGCRMARGHSTLARLGAENVCLRYMSDRGQVCRRSILFGMGFVTEDSWLGKEKNTDEKYTLG